jgi:hypothetical protein
MPPKASQEVSMCQTHPLNANTYPGRPILEAEAEEQLQNAKRKPHTKTSKVANDPYANESPEDKGAQIQKAAEQIAGIEDGMETLKAKVRETKPKPIHSHLHPTGKGNKVSIKGTASGMSFISRIMIDIDTYLEDMVLSDSEIDEVAGKSSKTKMQEKMTLVKEAIRNACSGSKADNIDASGACAITNNKGNNAALL